MKNLLEVFKREGLLERIVTNDAELPKVDPSMPQVSGSNVQTPSNPQPEVQPDPKAEVPQQDSAMKSAIAILNAAEVAIEHLFQARGKMPDEVQNKIKDIYDGIQQINANLLSLSNQSQGEVPDNIQQTTQPVATSNNLLTPVQNQGQVSSLSQSKLRA